MTTSPTLADLRVERPVPSEPGVWRGWEKRPATREDILTVLRELGGMERFFGPKTVGEYQLGKPGRYLIIPLGLS